MGGERLDTGWAFPVATDGRGDVSLESGVADVEAAIRIVLGTAPGERVMRPAFGCGIHEYAFDSETPSTRSLIESEVREALDRWEPRIVVETVDARTDEPGTVLIDIEYRVRTTDTRETVVYPFDLEAADG